MVKINARKEKEKKEHEKAEADRQFSQVFMVSANHFDNQIRNETTKNWDKQ